MILLSNKRRAYRIEHVVKPALLLFFLPARILAQDTVSLKDIEVSAKKTELSQVGKKTETIDTTIKEQFRYNSVADLLSYNSSVFIKSYGPGALATTAFRGGNASQTAVLWNGFNLQNAMLGQADLSLMPALLFENIGIEYGGSSSLWGSGAIGGSIHLDNKTAFGQGLVSAINLGAGSFGLFNGSASVLLSRQRFISSIKVYTTRSKNNFKYLDTLDQEHPNKRRRSAEYNFSGLMQEFKFLINQRQILSVSAWLNTNQRHLPDYSANKESKAYQTDEALRLTANWTYVVKKFRSVLRAGYFTDRIDYSDSLTSLFSKSKVGTVMIENENYIDLHKNYSLNVGVNVLSSAASTENYSGSKSLSRTSLLLGNKFSFFKERLLAYVAARAEYFSVGTLPLTWNMSLECKLSKTLLAKINAAKVYRQPTLNELYWVPGGNTELKPEKGYTYEGELAYAKQIRRLMLSVSGSAYSRIIANWILWTPESNNSATPVNIQEVWSRGTETSWKLNYSKNKFRVGTGIITGYVLSTVLANSQENDNTVDKQLIYTPRYTVNGHVMLGYARTELVFYHQYSGYRFTSSDNLTWLAPYHVSSLRLSCKVSIKEMDLGFFGACNNVFNTSYSVMAGMPMPLRNYELGISIKAKSEIKNKQLKTTP